MAVIVTEKTCCKVVCIYVHFMGWDIYIVPIYRHICVSKATFVFLKRVIFFKKVNLDNAVYLQILVSLLGKEGSYFLNKNCCFLRPSAFIFSFSWSCLRGLIALMGFTPRGALSLL